MLLRQSFSLQYEIGFADRHIAKKLSRAYVRWIDWSSRAIEKI
jgi:hypothetical protein